MDKIKSLFRPGGDADDNIMYGTPEPKNLHAEGGSSGQEAAEAPAVLHTDPESEAGKKHGGVMRQILNPGGDKYDEERYGTTAHSDKPLSIPTSGTPTDTSISTKKIESLPASEDKQGIARQILNPGGDKYDTQRYGETGVLAPGSELKSDETSSTLGGALPDRTVQSTGNESSGRSFPLSGGSKTASASDPAQRFGADEAVRQDQSTTSQSHLGRDATLGAGAGALAYGSQREPSSSLNDSSLVGGATGTQSHLGRDATLGAATGAVGTGALVHESQREPVSSYDRSSLTTGALGSGTSQTRESGLGSYGTSGALSKGDIHGDSAGYHHAGETPVEGYLHHTKGPHSTDIANVLDPHVAEALSTPAASSTLPTSSSVSHDGLPTEGTSHHYGRDAAVAGGVGAVGAGAYEATKGHTSENTAPLAQEQAAGSHHGHHEHNKLHKKDDPRGAHTDDKHEKALEKAREHEAATGGDHGEKKEGFLHKLLHHGSKDKADDHPTSTHEKSELASHSSSAPTNDGIVTEPHTGLPMNVGKYGSGEGGIDGASQIPGHHEPLAEGSAAETDWDKVKKGNTIY